MKKSVVLLFALAILAEPVLSQGQMDANLNRVSLGITAGLVTSFTDIKQNHYFPATDELSFFGGAKLEYHFSPVFGLRGHFLMGNLKGKDTRQNWHFQSEILESTLSGVVSISKLVSPKWTKNDRIDIYGLLGVGMLSYRSKHLNSLTDAVITSYGYSASGTIKESRLHDVVMPFGLGVRFKVLDRIDLEIESAFHPTKTDKLDGLNRIFSRDDVYNFTRIGIAFNLGRNAQSMKWASPSAIMYPGDVTRMDYLVERVQENSSRVEAQERWMQENRNEQEILALRKQIQDLEKRQNELAVSINSLAGQVTEVAEPLRAPLLSIFFRFNSAAIDHLNYERIAAMSQYMAANPTVKIELVGHADTRGPSLFNMRLSERRAKAVQDVLVNDFKVSPERLSVSYRGYNEPLSLRNLSINRRVDFILVGR